MWGTFKSPPQQEFNYEISQIQIIPILIKQHNIFPSAY